MRCKIEKLHRALKHLTAREACQSRKAVIQINLLSVQFSGGTLSKEQRA